MTWKNADRGSEHVYRWPEPVRIAIRSLVLVLREIAVGVDTWSGITHGVIPLDDRGDAVARRRSSSPRPSTGSDP